MARQPPQRDVAPPVQKLRVRYAKRGRLRFTSHRDIQRALERALRRASVPMAYSAGFTPHPKISYAGAAAMGAASEAEYLEISVTERLDPERVRAALDAALPAGLDVVEVVEAGPGALADRLEGSEWLIELPELPLPEVSSAAQALLAQPAVEVERMMKSGPRRFDARGPIVRLAAEPGQTGSGTPCAILRMVVRHATPAVRPDDVLTALRQVAGLTPPVPPLVTRLAQGPLDQESGQVADPLAADRASVAGAVEADPQPR
ncbi:MAG TPA: TIGR03936 family radical SAM-associated protein [Actinomycetes bacterium]|nr:TIGR03936 family radical SAM-associated protein [Actinomycetes bacterium]